MRRSLLCVIAAVFYLGLAGTAAIAGKNVVKEPLQTIEATPLLVSPLSPNQDCQVGNLNPPGWSINGFLYPPEAYKLVFDPSTCTVCPLGIQVTGVHILLLTAEATTIVMAVDVEEAVYASPGCPSPGPELCASPLYSVSIPAGGLWDVGLPISCNCLAPVGRYLLSVHFESVSNASGTIPGLITDAGPALLCTNWNNYGFGWYDLLAAYPDWPGNLNIYADVECCTPPVPVEEHSWGQIKALYRN